MAVYDHSYKNYAGPLTRSGAGFLVIRACLRDVFSQSSSRLLAICFIPFWLKRFDLPASQRDWLDMMRVNVRELFH